MLGLSPREARRARRRIIEFAELQEFVDLKLKNYSSGMHVRLAFSVMIQVDADVLLIDEVLAVGDAAFQQKCFDEFNRLRDEGTHGRCSSRTTWAPCSASATARCCSSGSHRDARRARARGGASTTTLNFGHQAAEPPPSDPREETEPQRRGDGTAEILDGWFENAQGERVTALAQGEACSLCTRVRFDTDIEDPHFGATFLDGEHHNVFAATTAWHTPHTGRFRKGEVVTMRIAFDAVFAPGRYYVAISVAREVTGQDILDHRTRVASLIVSGTRPGGGLVDLPHDFVVERGELAADAGPEPLERAGGV